MATGGYVSAAMDTAPPRLETTPDPLEVKVSLLITLNKAYQDKTYISHCCIILVTWPTCSGSMYQYERVFNFVLVGRLIS